MPASNDDLNESDADLYKNNKTAIAERIDNQAGSE
jgi:hypothetical protein